MAKLTGWQAVPGQILMLVTTNFNVEIFQKGMKFLNKVNLSCPETKKISEKEIKDYKKKIKLMNMDNKISAEEAVRKINAFMKQPDATPVAFAAKRQLLELALYEFIKNNKGLKHVAFQKKYTDMVKTL